MWTRDIVQRAGERNDNKRVSGERAIKYYFLNAGFSMHLLVSVRRSTTP